VGSTFPRAAEPAADATADELKRLDGVPGVMTLYGLANITIIVWWSGANPAAVQRLHLLTERRRREHPTGLSAVHIVKGDLILPDQTTRDAFVKLMKDSDSAMAAVAVVIGGSGFWASAARSAITGMRVLSRSAFEMRLHGQIAEVLNWLPDKHAKRTGVVIDPERLRRALESASASERALERAAS
jgi:hypothetical protein